MIVLCSYTDAAISKTGGGVGVVVRGYVEEGKKDTFLYRTYLPLPINVSQLDAELFGILVGVEQVGCAAQSNGLQPEDFYLKIFTDSVPAVFAIHHGPQVENARVRVLVKRIIRLVAGKYNKPPGGGAEYCVLSPKMAKPEQAVDAAYMLTAHNLSRMARTLSTDMLKR